MATLDSANPVRVALIWILAAALIYLLAGPVASTAPGTTLTLALGAAIMVVAFMSTEAAIYILICSMLLSPEFGATQGGIAEERSVTVRAEDLLILLIGFSWFARSAIQKELGLFPHTPLNRPIVLYIVACAFPTALGIMAGRIQPLSGVFYILKYIEYFVIFFMVVNFMYTQKHAKAFLTTALITCVIICLYGIAQIPGGERVSAPFEGRGGEPNTLGGYLVLMWSIVLGLYLTSSSPRLRRWMLVMSVLIVVPLMFTLSRASWGAALAMYVVLIVLSQRRLLLIGAAILLAAISPILLPPQVTYRVMNTFQAVRGYEATERIGTIALDPSASARVTTDRRAFQAWQESPIWGYGITGSGIFLDSQYFRTLVELGLIGLGAFLWLVWTAFRIGLHTYRTARTEFSRGLSLGYMAGLAGLMVHGIGSTTFIIIRIMEPFWLLTAIVLLMPTIEEVEEEVEKEVEQEFVRKKPMVSPRLPKVSSRAVETRRAVRARDLIRSHLDEEWK
jgi:O-antigen ligase